MSIACQSFFYAADPIQALKELCQVTRPDRLVAVWPSAHVERWGYYTRSWEREHLARPLG